MTPFVRTLRLLAPCFVALAASSCAAPSVSEETGADESEVMSNPFPEASHVKLPGFRLPNLDRALAEAALPAVPYAAALETLRTETPSVDQRTNHRVWLGKLTKAQCEVTKKTYADGWAAGLSGVDCDQDANRRGFFLDDFLTPVMQATLRRTFHQELDSVSRPLTDAEKRQYGILGGQHTTMKELSTNCWSTAYEVLRREGGAAPAYSIHNLLPAEVDVVFKDGRYSRARIGPDTARNVKSALDRFGAAFGDYVIVRGPDELSGAPTILHAAVLIDKNLAFERVGTKGEFPMRITTFDTIVKLYPGATYEVRRLTTSFPSPHANAVAGRPFTRRFVESFEGVVYDTTIVVKDLALVKDGRTKRYVPPAGAFMETMAPL